MYLSLRMVTDWVKFNCCNTEVSVTIKCLIVSQQAIIYTGVNDVDNLEKVPFGSIVNGNLKYYNGESISTVYEGTLFIFDYVTMYNSLKLKISLCKL